jgi:hypothetical protein
MKIVLNITHEIVGSEILLTLWMNKILKKDHLYLEATERINLYGKFLPYFKQHTINLDRQVIYLRIK